MRIGWEAAGASDIGRVRDVNEDAFQLDPERGIFLVADGMGGHAAGEVASALAVKVVERELTGVLDAGSPLPELPSAVAAAFRLARREIDRCCQDDPRTEGMGTTLTAAVLTPSGDCVIGHIGDSRAYRLRDGALTALTQDHTWVQREVDAGRLPRSAIRAHPFAHILTRVLSSDLPAEPDVLEAELLPGDLLLLTTDGLHGLVPDAEILALARGDGPLPDLLHALIARANQRGGHDNATAIAVRVLAAA